MKSFLRSKKRILILSSILILFLSVIGTLYYFKSKVDKVNNNEKYTTTLREADIKATDPIGVLLIGTDDGAGRSESDGARSDTLIYATINPKTKETNLYSISRDIFTWVDDDNYQKINAAYSIGREKQAAKAVEYLLDAPVDYYVSVNMTALSEIVDELGGIEVENKLGFTISIEDTEPSYKAKVKQGKQTINGEQALVYSRMRYQDPEGDVGRQKRQQEVIQAIITKLKQPQVLLKLDGLLTIVGNNVKTNVPTSNMISMFNSYLDALSMIKSTNIVGRGQMINNGYYMVVGKNNIKEIQDKIKKELELPVKDSLSWDNDINMLYVNDSELSLDPSVHYEFNSFKMTSTPIIEEEVPVAYQNTTSYQEVTTTPTYQEPVDYEESTDSYVPEQTSSQVITPSSSEVVVASETETYSESSVEISISQSFHEESTVTETSSSE